MRLVRLQVNRLPHFEDLHEDLAMQKSKRNFHTNALLLQRRRCYMPTKKNGAGEQQEYDESTRWYGESKTQWITLKRDFSNVQADENDLHENGKSSNIKLSKQECHSITRLSETSNTETLFIILARQEGLFDFEIK